MAPKANNSAPVAENTAETESPPKTKGTRKRTAASVALAEPKPSILQMLKMPRRTDPALQSVPTPMQKEIDRKPAPASTEAAPECESVPLQTEPAHEPMPKPKEVAAEPEASEHATVSELKVGSESYTCLCTHDPGTAGIWAERVTRDVDATGLSVLGLDCEWSPPWHRGPGVPDRLATLQLFHNGSSGRRALVFSIAGLGGELPSSMAALLGDARVAKVGVNVGGDASRLVRDFGCPVRGLYDLSNLNKKSGQKLRKAISLEDLVRTHCPEDMHILKSEEMMSKGVRTSNWEAWPLSAEQVEYAAKDAALGVMAFMMRFGMDGSVAELSQDAVDALVNLEEANEESVKAASMKKSASKRNIEEANTESAEAPATKKPKSKKKGAEAASEAKEEGEDSSPAEAKKDNKQHFFLAMRNSVLKAPNIGKKDHPQGPKDALAGVCIIVSGILDSFERKDMEEYVKSHGGSVSKTVTSKVTHLVTDHGEAGPSKQAKCKELGIPIVSEDVILKLVSDKC